MVYLEGNQAKGAGDGTFSSSTSSYLVYALLCWDRCRSCRIRRGLSCPQVCFNAVLRSWSGDALARGWAVLSCCCPRLSTARPPLLVVPHHPTSPPHAGSWDPCRHPRKSGRSSADLVPCYGSCIPQRDE